MAVKITRQPKNIVLLGSASSAAALRGGGERAPQAIRAAGIADRLKTDGFQVSDLGDTTTHAFQADEQHVRARNVSAVLKSLNDLRPRVETAVKSGALALVMSGDCISALAVIAGARRYYKSVSVIYVDRDVDLNTPATTASGCIDGMVISHVIGRGAPELVRFWGEPPLVREPDVALFGFERLDPPEEQLLVSSPLRRHPALEVVSVGPAVAARLALDRLHTGRHEFILHFDVDTITADEFPWTNSPGTGGLSLKDIREALRLFASQPTLIAFNVAGYNPELDPNGAGARLLVDLLADVLAGRLEEQPLGAEAAVVADAAPQLLTPQPIQPETFKPEPLIRAPEEPNAPEIVDPAVGPEEKRPSNGESSEPQEPNADRS